MRRIILAFILACFFGRLAHSQTDKGDWMVGGSLSVNTSKNNTTVGFTPSAGYFVMNNLAVGGNISYVYAKFGDNKSSTFGIGPFTRYYFSTRSVKPFLHGDISFTSTKFTLSGTENTETGFGYTLGAGLAFFINDNIAVEGLAGYDHSKVKDNPGEGGFLFNFGFQVYLHKQQVERLKGN